MPDSLQMEVVQLGADGCVELPRGWPCGMRADRSWWCRDPRQQYLIELSSRLLPDAGEPGLRPLDRAIRHGEALRTELARRADTLAVELLPTVSGVLLRSDHRQSGAGGARLTHWHSLLGFDGTVADIRFTLRFPADQAADPVVAALRDSLQQQATDANLTPASRRATLRDYRIGDGFVMAVPAEWRGQRQEDGVFWFHAPGGTPKLSIWHGWSDLPPGFSPDSPDLGLALAYDLQASLRQQGEDGDVEAAPLGGLVTGFRVNDQEGEGLEDDPPLAVTSWYYVIPVGGRLLTLTFGLMIHLAMQNEPWAAELPGRFRALIRELRHVPS